MTSRLRIASTFLLLAMMLAIIPSAVTAVSAATTCDWAQFVADVTVPDGTNYTANTVFRKTWRLKNIGSCTWTTSYALVFSSGERFGAPSSVNFPINVAPGQTVDLSVDMTAPSSTGHYFSYWKLKNAGGGIFGIGYTASSSFWAEINVTSTSGTGSNYDFSAHAAEATWSNGTEQLPFPGAEGDSRGFAIAGLHWTLEDYSAPQSSILVTPRNISNGYVQGTYPAFIVQRGDRFQTQVGCELSATSCYVEYRLDYQIVYPNGNGPIIHFWTFREKWEGLTKYEDVSLDYLAGQNVKFILVVSAYGSPVGDRAVWGNPIIARAGGPPPPPPPTGTKFDFGTGSSPLASGYSRVTETTAYSSGSFGWTDTSGLSSIDRGAPADDLKRDFVTHSSAARTFRVDLPNGSYSVNITMGDNNFARDNMIVRANGTTVLADVDSAIGGFAVNTFNVTVSGGSLALEFSDSGGSDSTWVVNALSITTTVPPPPADCDRAQFITDVTVPDGTTFAPSTTFKKTWRLKNVGTCTWTTGYSLIFDTGEKMSGPDSAPMPTNVAPGQTVDISINLTSPNAGGTYRGYWKFKNSLGAVFGIGSGGTKSFWVEIRVSGPTATPGTATATFTPVPPVAGVKYDFAANACQGTWFSGAGQLPCPGSEGDARGFVLKVTPSKLENGTSDGRMGLITFPQNVNNGYIQGFFPSYNVKSGDRFRSIVNCELNATSCYVVFRLDYQTGTSSIQTLWAFVERYEGQLYSVDLDLSSLVGKDVKFILTVLSTGSPAGDRALWVAPMIFNPAGVVTPTNTPVTQTPTLTPTPTATLTPPPTGYKYDFGTASSPLASGYARVTETTAYSSGAFGWTDTSGLESRDKSAVANDLNRDFVMHSSAARTFKVDLPNGNYSVNVTMGDNDFAHDNMVVKANGTTVLADVDNAAGAFTSNTFPVTVSGGSVAFEFSDPGGTDPTWVVNALTLTPIPTTSYKFDFGTATSPLSAGYTRVTESTAYTSGAFGWVATAGLESRDRSAVADDLKRDFVLNSSSAQTFRVDLSNGNYTVNVTMGDNDFAHDNMMVKANGTLVLPDVDNATGSFTANTFSVAVTSGFMTLEFADGGGADPTWVVNAITITP